MKPSSEYFNGEQHLAERSEATTRPDATPTLTRDARCNACGVPVGDPHIRDCPNLVDGPTFWPKSQKNEANDE